MAGEYEIVDHTADVAIVARGADVGETFASAGRALLSIVTDPDSVAEVEERRIELAADVPRALAERGISVRVGSMSGLAEEASQAYKDVDQVVDITEQAGISRRVVKAVPLGVIKG